MEAKDKNNACYFRNILIYMFFLFNFTASCTDFAAKQADYWNPDVIKLLF
jgi:hypothetical protein